MDTKQPSLWNKLKALYSKHEQIIRYLVVGGLTTVISYAVYALCLLLIDGTPYDYEISTAVSFVAAVIFAYFANKHAVFKSETKDRRDAMREVGSFFLMRAISFAFELGMMKLAVDVLHINKWIAKLPVNVVIVLVNYMFSKLFIFRKSSNPEQ